MYLAQCSKERSYKYIFSGHKVILTGENKLILNKYQANNLS